MLKIGWFSTGRGEGSRGLLRFVHEHLSTEGIDARIEFVFSNRAPGEAEGSDEYFRLVQDYALSLITLSSADFRRRTGGRIADRREEYDAEVLAAMSGRSPDICVLAGYMLIASSRLCRAFPLLNLHPALPDGPIGTWQEVVWQLIDQRAARTGAMMHLATEEVDRGPLVSYVTVPLETLELGPLWEGLGERQVANVRGELGEDYELFRKIREAQYMREPYLLLETLRALSDGEVALNVGRTGEEVTVNDLSRRDGDSYGGLCLNREVERAMAKDGLL